MNGARVAALAENVDRVVGCGFDERLVTREVAALLREALARGLDLAENLVCPRADKYAMYPLYIDPDERFSIASAVWDVGQGTPVHGHETWGVVGIYSGREHEVRYEKPTRPNVPLVKTDEHTWNPGAVTICCTTDDDVHAVDCAGHSPCVGIHIYGANIGTLNRRAYDPTTGAVQWFVSRWAQAGP